jgi:hypothetical protein
MMLDTHTPTGRTLGQVAGWAIVAIAGLYAAFAVTTAAGYLLDSDPAERSLPPLFVAHALTGAVALVTGSLQLRLARTLLSSRPGAHRLLGRGYLGAAWLTSVASVAVAVDFDITTLGRAALVVAALAWFTATTTAFLHIRRGRVQAHREWMIRSFSLALFFITFSLWVPLLESAGFSDAVSYPVGVTLSWTLNLLVAELRVRTTR